MYKFLTRYRSSQSGLFIATLVVGCLSCSLTTAQTRVFTDQFGNPIVSVDYTTLDELGPPPNLPELYRRTTPAASRLFRDRRIPTQAPDNSRLAKPPLHMPRSKLNLPNTLKPSKSASSAKKQGMTGRPIMPTEFEPTKAVTPPVPASITLEKRPTQSEGPIDRVRSKVVKPRAVPKSKLNLPPKIASKVPAALSVKTLKQPKPGPITKLASKPKMLMSAASPPAPPKPAIVTPKPAAAPQPVKTPPAPTIAPKVAAPKIVTRVARAPAPATSPVVGTVAVSPDGNLLSIPFAEAKTDLPPKALPTLDKLAIRMNTNENIRIQLMGFANGKNSSGSRARRSSLFRALSIRNYLMKQGVRTTRMDVRALGQNSIKGVPPDRVDIVVQP